MTALNSSLWLLLPAIIANMAPVIVTRYNILPTLNYPLDGHKTWRGQRLLGSNKTWRGLLIGLFAAVITALLQAPFDYVMLNLVFGASLGLGALAGDATKSFFKRQLKIPSGTSWIPFDQIDFALGTLFAASFFIELSLATIITATIIIGFGSYVVSYFGVALKIKMKQ